jgi:hypothetical protein
MIKINSSWESLGVTAAAIAAVAALNYLSLHLTGLGLSSFWVSIAGLGIKEAITEIDAVVPAAAPTTPSA